MPSYYDPFSQMMTLSDAINRLVADSFVSPRATWGSGRLAAGHLAPPMDVQETAEDYVVEVSLPGWKPESVNISINGNALTISGKGAEADPEAPANAHGRRSVYHLRERSTPAFERSFAFPTAVNSDAAKATFQNGVLTLTIPKAETAKARRIPISGEQGQLQGSKS